MPTIHQKFLNILDEVLAITDPAYKQLMFPIIFSTTTEKMNVLGISRSQAIKLEKMLIKSFSKDFGLIPNDALLHYSRPVSRRVQTPYKPLNKILGGGFELGKTYLVYGVPGSGKSEFCYLAIKSFLDYAGKIGTGDIAVIDPDQAFRPERLNVYGPAIQLKKIKIATCYSLPHLEILINNILAKIDEDPGLLLLIIDSMMASSFELDGFVKKFKIYGRIMKKIANLAVNNDVCVLYTNNQVRYDEMPSGANIFMEYADVILELKEKSINDGKNALIMVKGDIEQINTIPFVVNDKGMFF